MEGDIDKKRNGPTRRALLSGIAASIATGGVEAARSPEADATSGEGLESVTERMSIDKKAAEFLTDNKHIFQFDLKAGWIRVFDSVMQRIAYANAFDAKSDSYITISLTHDNHIMVRTIKKDGAREVAIMRVEADGRVHVERMHYMAPLRRPERKQ